MEKSNLKVVMSCPLATSLHLSITGNTEECLQVHQAKCVQAEHKHTHTKMAYLDILKAFSLLWSPAWAPVPACLQDMDSAGLKGVKTHHETTM